jgi:FkbM family methyltransferase
MKKMLKHILHKFDLDIRRPSNITIRFGVSWFEDLAYFVQGKGLGTVLDVGANVGDVTTRLAKFFPESDIFSFEPVPATYEKLVQNTRNLKRVTLTQGAMFSSLGESQIAAVPLSGQNRLMMDDSVEDPTSGKKTATVPLLTVDDFCDRRGIDRAGLLKTDTEGYDLHVLQGAESRLTSGSIEFILAECAFPGVGPDPGHTSFDEIQKYVVPFGYHVVSFYTGGVNELGWIWGDVLFRHVAGRKSGDVCVIRPCRGEFTSAG